MTFLAESCDMCLTAYTERSKALPAFLDHYNYDRPHSACGGLPPMSRVNNVLARNN